MLLRRHKRIPDYVPKVNGTVVQNPPKEKSLNVEEVKKIELPNTYNKNN